MIPANIKPVFSAAALVCLALAVLAVSGIVPSIRIKPDTILLLGILCAVVN